MTIAFCDICDFDSIVKNYSGKELVRLLDELYNAFD